MTTHTQNSPARESVGSTPGWCLSKEDRQKWDLHYLRLAFMTARNLSKDPATKVGAMVVTPDFRKVSTGYNGFPPGVAETPERWSRPEKYDWVVHAEVNALHNAPFDTRGCWLYVTIPPCDRCWGEVVTAGIARVVTYRTDRPVTGRLDVIADLSARVAFTQYEGDPVIDGLKDYYENCQVI
jgi:dCMP deaminase